MKKSFKNIFRISSIIFCVLFLTSCQPINGEEILEKIFPNLWAVLIQIIAFLVLVVCVIFLLYKPVKNYLKKRRELLDNEVNITLDEKKKATENRLESETNIAVSKKTASEIISKAEKDAHKRGNLIIDDANREAQIRMEEATDLIEKEKSKAIQDVRGQIINVALVASSEVLKKIS